jgi:hypothetical protein
MFLMFDCSIGPLIFARPSARLQVRRRRLRRKAVARRPAGKKLCGLRKPDRRLGKWIASRFAPLHRLRLSSAEAGPRIRTRARPGASGPRILQVDRMARRLSAVSDIRNSQMKSYAPWISLTVFAASASYLGVRRGRRTAKTLQATRRTGIVAAAVPPTSPRRPM